MKLAYLHLEQVKQFRQPLHLDDLSNGINLFVGPNESGKSTLVDAIRAAFFERAKSRSVDHLQPWGDSSAAPQVELAFDWRGERWVLIKRFLHKPRCDLTIGSARYAGTEAEDKLAALFGYAFASKGASRPELQGIPGLLWVRQGRIQDLNEPVGHASDQLQLALGTSLGEVASSAGDELIAAVEKERRQWLTGTGRPSGDYKIAIDACEAGQGELDALDTRIKDYRQQVDELGRLRERRRSDDLPQPWNAERALASAAQARLDEVRRWQVEQQQDQTKLDNCQRSQEFCHQQLRGFETASKQLRERATAMDKAQAKFDDLQARQPDSEASRVAAKTAYDQAKAAAAQAHQQARRTRVQGERDTLAATLADSRKKLEQAQRLQQELGALREQQQAGAIDDKLLGKLKRSQGKRDKLAIQRESLATRLQYRLLAGKQLTVGDQTVSGEGERLLLEATELTIPDVGSLRLQPGGKDVAALARDEERARTHHDALLAELGIASLAEGEQRAAGNKDLTNRIEREVVRLEGLAPEGIDARAEQCRLGDQRLAALAEQLDGLPPADPDAPDEASADAETESASARLEVVEAAAATLATDLATARQASTTAAHEWTSLKQEQESDEWKDRYRKANDELADTNAEASRLDDAIAARRQQIDAAQPEALHQDIARHTASAAAMEADANRRKQTIEVLQARLEAMGAEGLEEQRETLQQTLAAHQRRRDELARRTQALTVLHALLHDKRQALTRRIQAPLQKHLDHYLKLLFPQASLSVDDALTPAALTRQAAGHAENGKVGELSYGTREQMGLISRLAYADLLRDAGQPTLIILDDALVHSDAGRLAQMKRMLFDAARRHQILLFSCHPENWRDLGVAARDLQTLRVSAA